MALHCLPTVFDLGFATLRLFEHLQGEAYIDGLIKVRHMHARNPVISVLDRFLGVSVPLSIHKQECYILGICIDAMVHTFPFPLFVKPVYVAPLLVEMVFPKVASAAASVMTVFVYVCAAIVPVHESSHSVPVP